MVTIRSLQGEEMLEAAYSLNSYAFHASPPLYDQEEWNKAVRERRGVTYHALFEDGLAVAGAASTAMTQNVRGKLFPAGGVWGVATRPDARRKGYCRRAMGSLLAAESQSGKVFSNLYPFRESFYERQGYVTLPLPMLARLAPASLAPLLGKDFGGEVEQRLISEAFDIYRAYLAEMRLRTHGMAFFDFGDRAAASRNRQWAALAKFDGGIEGLMLYSLGGDEVTHLLFRAGRFYARTSRARYLLLDWIARHVDQADRVEMMLAPFERPETWLADIQLKLESQVRAPMSRVLTVAGLGGMACGEGCFSALIRDPLCPWNESSWQFAGAGGLLQVSRAEQADCELSIQALSGLVMGTHDPQDFTLRGWGNPAEDIQAVMRAMFPPLLPYLHEIF